MTRPVPLASYALQVQGEQDEYGVAENVYRFEATLAGLDGRQDLCMIRGFFIDHEEGNDLCVEILQTKDPKVHCKPVKVVRGCEVCEALRSADVRARVSGKKTLFLFDPIVLDINDQREPGTRLISALQRHFSDQNVDVVVDLGTEEEDIDFNEYFFPDLDILDLECLSSRLFVGRWGRTEGDEARFFDFGVKYS